MARYYAELKRMGLPAALETYEVVLLGDRLITPGALSDVTSSTPGEEVPLTTDTTPCRSLLIRAGSDNTKPITILAGSIPYIDLAPGEEFNVPFPAGCVIDPSSIGLSSVAAAQAFMAFYTYDS